VLVGAPSSSGTGHTIFHADGSKEVLVSDITGQKWTSTDTAYGVNGKPVSEVWSDGDTVVRTQHWNANGSVHDVHYYGITGRSYTDYDIVYGANGKAASASYSDGMTQTWTYKADGGYEIVTDGIAGQKWTSIDSVYGANGKLASQVWSNGDTILRTQHWNGDGSLHDINYYGIAGRTYTEYGVVYGANGKAASASYSDGMSESWIYKADGSYGMAFDHIQGSRYQSYVNIYDP